METTYLLTEDHLAIQCLVCGMTSYHPKDVEHLYCGKCHRFHDTVGTPPLSKDAYRLLKAIVYNEGPPEGLVESPHHLMVSFFQRGLLEKRDEQIYATSRAADALVQYQREA